MLKAALSITSFAILAVVGAGLVLNAQEAPRLSSPFSVQNAFAVQAQERPGAGTGDAPSGDAPAGLEVNPAVGEGVGEAPEGIQVMPESAFGPQGQPPQIDQDSIAPIEWMQYKFFRAPDGYTAGIWAILNESVQLPAVVQIAVPSGANVFFFGPIPPEGITPESPQFTDFHVYTEDGQDIYTALLLDSHQFQIEHYFWGENFSFPVTNLDDGDHMIRISYRPLQDLPTLRLAAFLPAGSAARDAVNVEFLGQNADGDPAFARTFTDVHGGETISTEIVYAPPEITARATQSASLGWGVIAAVAAVAVSVIAILGFLVFLQRQRRS